MPGELPHSKERHLCTPILCVDAALWEGQSLSALLEERRSGGGCWLSDGQRAGRTPRGKHPRTGIPFHMCPDTQAPAVTSRLQPRPSCPRMAVPLDPHLAPWQCIVPPFNTSSAFAVTPVICGHLSTTWSLMSGAIVAYAERSQVLHKEERVPNPLCAPATAVEWQLEVPWRWTLWDMLQEPCVNG